MRLLALSAATFLLLTAPSPAEDLSPWKGLAVSQAPEAGLGICFGESPGEAMKCAQAQCMEQSGLGQEDCQVNLWCYPHAFAADIFMQHAEGPHWHEYLCGAQDMAELEAMIGVKCDRDYLIECAPVTIWNMDGEEQPIEVMD